MIEIDKNNLYYKQLDIVKNTKLQVPAGEAWKVIAYYKTDQIPKEEVLYKVMFYYDQFSKQKNTIPQFTFSSFNNFFKPKINFIDEKIPYMLYEMAFLEPYKQEGFFIIAKFDIIKRSLVS